jgi:spore germination cell wall hydrolase CwlJ-like protein
MLGYVRAAGFAVAAIGAALVPTLANPSMAWQLEPSVQTANYTEHAAASLEGPAPAIEADNVVKTLTQDIDVSAPVAQHAIASVLPEAAAPEAKEEKLPLRSLAALVDEHAGADVSDSELHCLAGAIYFESKGEPLAGQLAVAEVIINRAKSGRYPSTLCGVVKQRGQFSFVRGGQMPPIAKGTASWRNAVAIAHIAAKDLADSPASKALSFHARRVSPGWKLTRIATVGNHIFYR